MKDPMRFVDRFCSRHPGFGIPGLARYLAVGSGAVWVIGLINRVLYGYLTFSAAAVPSVSACLPHSGTSAAIRVFPRFPKLRGGTE